MKKIYTLIFASLFLSTVVAQTFSKNLETSFQESSSFSQVTPTYVYVTFYVDLYDGPINLETDTVYISGTFNNWLIPGNEGSYKMTDLNNNYYFSTTIPIEENSGEVEYKYYINAGLNGVEWEGEPNRIVEVGKKNIIIHDIWSKLVGHRNDVEENITMYPNPFCNNLTIENLKNYKYLQISTILGQPIQQMKISENSININTSDLYQGIYLITLIDYHNTSTTHRLIKR